MRLLAQHFCTQLKRAMKPQQQNTDIEAQSHVYVQKPDGDVVNVPAPDPSSLEGKSDADKDQTAANTPTTHSKEVTDGEDA